MSAERKPPKRSYPPVYEKLIPIAIGVIVILIIAVVAIIIAISAGLI